MIHRACIVISIVCLFLGHENEARAWDGKRKGFILGIGVGPGLTSFNQTLTSSSFSVTSDRERKTAVMSDFRIGYAPTNLLQIYWMSKISWFTIQNVREDDVTIANGFGGIGVTYSLQEIAPSAFLTAGIGFSTWATPFEQGSTTMYGFGIVAGAGFEFARHWSLEFDLMWGKPNDTDRTFELSTNALSFKLTLNVLAY